jgi:hypothetical protein
MTRELESTAAPADLRPHAPWSTARKIAAYLALFALALASIWFINRRVDQLANDAPFTRPAPSSS